MLPFTTYNIPESGFSAPPSTKAWLWMVVDQPPADTEKAMLDKMASALKANPEEDVFTLCLRPDAHVSVTDVDVSQIKLIISFGVDPAQLGIWIEAPAQSLRILESFVFIRTLPVSTMVTNANAKKELWSAMQTYLELYAEVS